MKKGNKIPDEEKVIDKRFSKRIKDLRKEANLTQETVAKKLGCNLRTYRNWENAKTYPDDIVLLMDLAGLYNVSLDYLLCRTNELNIGDDQISFETGLSVDALEALRIMRSRAANYEVSCDLAIRFLNRELERIGGMIGRLAEGFRSVDVELPPVPSNIFEKLEIYVTSDDAEAFMFERRFVCPVCGVNIASDQEKASITDRRFICPVCGAKVANEEAETYRAGKPSPIINIMMQNSLGGATVDIRFLYREALITEIRRHLDDHIKRERGMIRHENKGGEQ